MRKGERPFSVTKYAKRRYKPETVARRMLARGYYQVSRRYGHVSRVDVSRKEMVEFFVKENFGCRVSGVPCLSLWQQEDQYRRCVSEDVITGVPEPIMFMIRNPGERFVYRPPRPDDDEYVAMMVELGMVR